MSPLLRIYQTFEMFSQLQFSPVDNKIKELVRPVALPELLAPLHIETRVELHNPDVLIVVRTVAGPGCARHHVASVHGIGADLFKENYSLKGGLHPGSLGHAFDVDGLGRFHVSLQVEGPDHGAALVVDEETPALEAVSVPGCHKGVAILENSSDAPVSIVIWIRAKNLKVQLLNVSVYFFEAMSTNGFIGANNT